MKDQAQLQTGLAGGFSSPALTVKVSTLCTEMRWWWGGGACGINSLPVTFPRIQGAGWTDGGMVPSGSVVAVRGRGWPRALEVAFDWTQQP